MSESFEVRRGGSRVIFGAGARGRLAAALSELGARRVLVISTPGRSADAEAVARGLGDLSLGVLALARRHVPAALVDEATEAVRAAEADTVLAYGGGSAIGLAKAVALGAPVRVAAVPTTYSGSELTDIYGVTTGGYKQTGRDPRVRPALVVYDPELTMALPEAVTVPSLFNAMAHACEALWAPAADPATRLAAEAGLSRLAASAVRLAAHGGDRAARATALEGAYLAATALDATGAGVHHTLCHVLGGLFDLPHAETHTVLLPHVLRLQAGRAPEALAAIARALGVVDPVRGMTALLRATGAPTSLAALGMPEDGIARAVDAALASPRLAGLDRAAVTAVIEAAFEQPAAGAAAPALRAPGGLETQPGLGSTHTSEALPGALPPRQNMPHPAPYGLLIECLNGTPFTVKSAENSRVWLYRIRASFDHDALTPLPPGPFCAPLGEVDPNRRRWQPLPIPEVPTDFVDGLHTLGGAGDPTAGAGWQVHLYAANQDMGDRAFSNQDGDLLLVPQEGALHCRTELGWLTAAPGTVILIPRALKFSIGLPEGRGRGWILETYGRRLRLPERGPIGASGLADARHFLAPVASYEDRLCEDGFQLVTKLGGKVYAAMQAHSPYDVVAWHGNHAPFSYDLMLFNAMGSVTFDHPDPSILTVLTCPLDDLGRATADFVVFPPRWHVAEHSFRPPYMHRNAASEVNLVLRTAPGEDYVPGHTFVSPLLTAHGISTKSYDAVLDGPQAGDAPMRLSDDSLWAMFESAMPFRSTEWARTTPLSDAGFLDLFTGMKSRFDPDKP